MIARANRFEKLARHTSIRDQNVDLVRLFLNEFRRCLGILVGDAVELDHVDFAFWQRLDERVELVRSGGVARARENEDVVAFRELLHEGEADATTRAGNCWPRAQRVNTRWGESVTARLKQIYRNKRSEPFQGRQEQFRERACGWREGRKEREQQDQRLYTTMQEAKTYLRCKVEAAKAADSAAAIERT